jgi:hypothetical protein
VAGLPLQDLLSILPVRDVQNGVQEPERPAVRTVDAADARVQPALLAARPDDPVFKVRKAEPALQALPDPADEAPVLGVRQRQDGLPVLSVAR